jgi:hypothetical protein
MQKFHDPNPNLMAKTQTNLGGVRREPLCGLTWLFHIFPAKRQTYRSAEGATDVDGRRCAAGRQRGPARSSGLETILDRHRRVCGGTSLMLIFGRQNLQILAPESGAVPVKGRAGWLAGAQYIQHCMSGTRSLLHNGISSMVLTRMAGNELGPDCSAD